MSEGSATIALRHSARWEAQVYLAALGMNFMMPPEKGIQAGPEADKPLPTPTGPGLPPEPPPLKGSEVGINVGPPLSVRAGSTPVDGADRD